MNRILLALIAIMCLTGVCFAQAPTANLFLAVQAEQQTVEEWADEKLADRMKRLNMAEWEKESYVTAPVASAFAVIQDAPQPVQEAPSRPRVHDHQQSPVQKGHYSAPQVQWYYGTPAPSVRRGLFGRQRGTGPVRGFLFGRGGC